MTDFISLMFMPFSQWGILIGGTMIFFVLGWIWYNPITPIGRKWMELNKLEPPKPGNMPKSYEFVVMLILQLFMGFIVTHSVMVLWNILGRVTLDDLSILDIGNCPLPTNDCSRLPLSTQVAMLSGYIKTFFIIKIYMGFVFIKDLGHWYFEKKPFLLILIGTGYYLVGILGVCGLLSYFL